MLWIGRIALVAFLFCTVMTLIASFGKCEGYPSWGLPYEYEDEAVYTDVNDLREANGVVKNISEKSEYSGELSMVMAIDEFVRLRFKHGYSQLSFCDDWFLDILAIFWRDLRSPVQPDDILQYNFAGCSQQSLVVQNLAKENDIDFMTFGWVYPTHFASALKADGVWYYVDPDLYPENDPPIKLEKIVSGESIEHAYKKHLQKEFAYGHRSGAFYMRSYNENPAIEATVLQKCTKIFSDFGWLFFLFISLILNNKFGILRSVSHR